MYSLGNNLVLFEIGFGLLQKLNSDVGESRSRSMVLVAAQARRRSLCLSSSSLSRVDASLTTITVDNQDSQVLPFEP
ncbi:hypothetical protein U1Q18_003915 [Sarracenia purpurea var. burkii]